MSLGRYSLTRAATTTRGRSSCRRRRRSKRRRSKRNRRRRRPALWLSLGRLPDWQKLPLGQLHSIRQSFSALTHSLENEWSDMRWSNSRVRMPDRAFTFDDLSLSLVATAKVLWYPFCSIHTLTLCDRNCLLETRQSFYFWWLSIIDHFLMLTQLVIVHSACCDIHSSWFIHLDSYTLRQKLPWTNESFKRGTGGYSIQPP